MSSAETREASHEERFTALHPATGGATPTGLLHLAWSTLRSGGWSSLLVLAVLTAFMSAAAIYSTWNAYTARTQYAEALAAGGNILVVSGEGAQVSALDCERLVLRSDVTASGALSRAAIDHAESAPGEGVQTALATSGLFQVLDPRSDVPAAPGVVLGSGAAADLGAGEGTDMRFVAAGPTQVTGVIDMSERADGFQRWMFFPGRLSERVEECWVEADEYQRAAVAETLQASFPRDAALRISAPRAQTPEESVDDSLTASSLFFPGAAALLAALVMGVLLKLQSGELALLRICGLGSPHVVIVVMARALALGGLATVLSAGAVAGYWLSIDATQDDLAAGLRAGVLVLCAAFVASWVTAARPPRNVLVTLRDR